MNPRISVIIPVYKVEKYIVECLESVRLQTFSDYEAIIVNDGSPDRCSEIIEEYIEKYRLSNFTLLNKENGGISSARNFGLEYARGEWIFFLDSDDWLEYDALKILVECLHRHPSDLVFGGIRAVDDVTRKSEDWNHYPKKFGVIPEEWYGLHSFEFSVARLYNKAVIDKHNLRFDTRIKYGEDNAWQLDYISKIKSYSCSESVVYNYRINRAGSLTSGLVYPSMKYFNWIHLQEFINAFDIKSIENAIKTNQTFSRVAWNILITAVSNEFLEGRYKSACKIKKLPFALVAVKEYQPRSRKDKIFSMLWRYSFPLLCLVVRIYYKNFEKLRHSWFIKRISRL